MDREQYPNYDVNALALLYVQNQDLSDKTPEQLLDLYVETKQKIEQYGKLLKKKYSKANPPGLFPK